MTDYSKHPETVGELRAGQTDDAKDWTPRDVLLSLLREIDSGKMAPEALAVVVVGGNTGALDDRMRLVKSCKDSLVIAGAMALLLSGID